MKTLNHLDMISESMDYAIANDVADAVACELSPYVMIKIGIRTAMGETFEDTSFGCNLQAAGNMALDSVLAEDTIDYIEVYAMDYQPGTPTIYVLLASWYKDKNTLEELDAAYNVVDSNPRGNEHTQAVIDNVNRTAHRSLMRAFRAARAASAA